MNKLKVLIGDNSMAFGQICKDILSKTDVDVTLLPKDGEVIRDVALRTSPDIIVIEAFMVRLDAIGVLKALNEHAKPFPKVIVISGCDNLYIANEVLANGAFYYMIQPFNIEDLCNRILSIGQSTLPSHPVNPFIPNSSDARADNKETDLESIVTDVILHIGIPAHIKGYCYIRAAIILSIEDPNMINSVTKLLYPKIAQIYNSTSSRVERAIRHAIEIAWDRGDVDTLDSYFGYTINNGRGKPTNSEFIAMISDKLRLQLKKQHMEAK